MYLRQLSSSTICRMFNSLEPHVSFIRQLLFQFVILNLFTSSGPRDKVRLIGNNPSELLILKKRMLFSLSLL